MDADEFFIEEGDLEAARALVQTTTDAELFLYRGTAVSTSSPTTAMPSYDEHAAPLLTERVLGFLDGLK